MGCQRCLDPGDHYGESALAPLAPTERAHRCACATPARSLISYVEDRPGHDTRYAINARKITTELGYQPLEDFESGLNKTVDWYLANEAWWQSILDGSTRA